MSPPYPGSSLFCALLLTSTCLIASGGAEGPDPAPTVDRVGFPADYARTYTVLRETTDPRAGTRVTVYGNAAAASIDRLAALPYPYGSVLVMETARLKRDVAGQLAVDALGKPVPDVVVSLHVMRREAGFGADYASRRAGEWEFVEYAPDGAFITPPEKSASCAGCHQKDARPARDFVFKARFAEGSDAGSSD